MIRDERLSPATIQRLSRYGDNDATPDQIVNLLLDRIDEEEFVREMRRRAVELDAADSWVKLD